MVIIKLKAENLTAKLQILPFPECNTEVAMDTIGEARNLAEAKTKMAESRYTSSDEIVADQLKLKAKKQKYY